MSNRSKIPKTKSHNSRSTEAGDRRSLSQCRSRDVSMAFDFPSNHPRAAYFDRATRAISTSESAALNIQPNPGGKIHPGVRTLDAVRDGIVDIGWINAAHLEAIDPRLGAVNLPFGLGDNVMEPAHARAGAIRFMNEFCRPQGLRVLAIMRGADQMFVTRDSHLETLSDIRGLRVRVAGGGIYEAIVQSVGARPVVIPIPHVLSAISSDEINSIFTSPGAWQTLFAADMPYGTCVPGLMMINYVLLAGDTFCSALPPDSYRTIETAFERHVTNAWQDMASDDVEILGSMERYGARVQAVLDRDSWLCAATKVHGEFSAAWPGVLGKLADAVGVNLGERH